MCDEKKVAEVADKLLGLLGEELLERLNWKEPAAWSVGPMCVASFNVVAPTRAKAKRVALSQDFRGGDVYVLVNVEGGALAEAVVAPERVRSRLLEMIDGEHFNG